MNTTETFHPNWLFQWPSSYAAKVAVYQYGVKHSSNFLNQQSKCISSLVHWPHSSMKFSVWWLLFVLAFSVDIPELALYEHTWQGMI